MGKTKKRKELNRARAAASEEAQGAATKKKKQKTLISLCVGVFIVVLSICVGLYLNDDSRLLHHAEITVKDYGVISVELDESAAPETVKNFLKLAKHGFYDGLTFHRVEEGFMIQGGDPTGTGFWGADKTITGEFSLNGYDNPILMNRGVIAMARSGDNYDSATSQFFILQQDYSPMLDGGYAAFGHVTDGMDVVDQICADAHNWERNAKNVIVDLTQQPVIESVKVLD